MIQRWLAGTKTGVIIFLLKNNIKIKASKMRSLVKLCQGVSGIASPKQPQSIPARKHKLKWQLPTQKEIENLDLKPLVKNIPEVYKRIQ